MALDFKLKDVLHSIVAQFRRNSLPSAKKPYNLHAAEQPTLDIHGIASKAEVYNISTSPKVIEEGMTAGLELLHYLVADGYKINTPFFDVHIRIPGEYDGTETHLPEGVKPEAALSVSPELRRYLAEHVQVTIIGKDDVQGSISLVTDMSTGLHDSITRSGVVWVEGAGLKVVFDAQHQAQCGLWFVHQDTGERIKSHYLIDNIHTCVKAAIRNTALTAGAKYFIEIVTQSSARKNASIVKNIRTVRSEQAYTAL
jgi:hypothetical protein